MLSRPAAFSSERTMQARGAKSGSKLSKLPRSKEGQRTQSTVRGHMAPIVRVATGGDEAPTFLIPFRRPFPDPKMLQQRLPELQEELSASFPGTRAQLTYRTRTFRNPIDPSQIARLQSLATSPKGIAIFLGGTAAYQALKEAGRQFGGELGKGVGRQVSEFVVRWLQRLEPRKKKASRTKKPPRRRNPRFPAK